MTVDCKDCPLRGKTLFHPMSASELAFMQRFKLGERVVAPGTQLLSEGEPSDELFTVLSGLGLRSKSMANGGRQVVGVVFPGDFVGLQAGVMGAMQHSVEARTEMTVCVFRRRALWDLFREHPERAHDLTWLAALEEHLLGESLAAVGQLSGKQRVARGLYRLYLRGSALGLVRDGRMPMPFIQQDLADALGLSLVHTNKLLRAMGEGGIARWSNGHLHVLDDSRLRELALVEEEGRLPPRPLI
ncbi:MAG: Crp/Fnr family transcriptional regulator [Rhodovulum sp.]